MKFQKLLLTLLGFIFSSVVFANTITGAGATFPYPLYAKWAAIYKQQTGTSINYQAIGSSSGIKQVESKTVDFGASDIPLTADKLNQMQLMQFPTVVGGIVPIVNIKGIPPGQLKLTGPLLANIYLGKITKWNDMQIVKLNPNLTLPNQSITTIHRADGSGTTFIFTHYLAKVSPEWQKKVGSAAAIQWPNGIGGKGNEGVAQYVSRIQGSIGYVEHSYAKQSNMSYTQLQNKAGHFVLPTPERFSAAAQYAQWNASQGFYEILTDQEGQNSWPITAATFILIAKKPSDPNKTYTILRFFEWAFTQGQNEAKALDYIPLPTNVVSSIKAEWKKNFPAIYH